MQLFMPMLREGTLPFGIDFANRLNRSTRPSVLRQQDEAGDAKHSTAWRRETRHTTRGLVDWLADLTGSIEHFLIIQPNSDKKRKKEKRPGEALD